MNEVRRVFVEKKKDFAVEAAALFSELRNFLNIKNLTNIRVITRYETEGLSQDIFQKCAETIFSEMQLDAIYYEMPEIPSKTAVFAVESIPGQFDLRSDSALRCIEMSFQIEKALVRAARVYVLYGDLSENEINKIKRHLINPLESREASLELSASLRENYEEPAPVIILNGFRLLSDNGVLQLCKPYNLALDNDDILFIRDYFIMEGRDPTNVELKILDAYWSDHCRHTTFNTIIKDVTIEDKAIKQTFNDYLAIKKELGCEKKDITLMDIATIGARYLKKKGKLQNLIESEENNACTIKIDAQIKKNGSKHYEKEKWLLLFKNETHNHPTEIEPFGGAATCIGGAIRDPLSGRAYVYQAMRISGAGNPLEKIEDTLHGKLPQRKIITQAAQGYSSYGNQIGLATGLVKEYYHEGFRAKHLELGAVLGAAPDSSVVRKKPKTGDVVVLTGGRTGRDGIGGASGSSKAHNAITAQCGAEVQKGCATEERKLQRLFRNPKVSRLIKKCNDFGAGGIAVAIGELTGGIEIDLSKVQKKYAGLSAFEIAISESQERMAVLLAKKDAAKFIKYAAEENLEAAVVAEVTEEERLVMKYKGETAVDIARDFLDSNGAEKETCVLVKKQNPLEINSALDLQKKINSKNSIQKKFEALVSDINIASQKGLSERFDSTVGAGTVLAGSGGKFQAAESQVMCALLPVIDGKTKTASLFAAGFNPVLMAENPYLGAYYAVIESVSKIIASGAKQKDIALSFQEYFEKLGDDEEKWGKPFSALLGALKAQLELNIAAIGGKDSMSGTYSWETPEGKKNISVPPALISFAAAPVDVTRVVSNEFKSAGNYAALLTMKQCEKFITQKKVISAYALESGGIAEAVYKMSLGNKIGFAFNKNYNSNEAFQLNYGFILAEISNELPLSIIKENGRIIGKTIKEFVIKFNAETIQIDALYKIWKKILAPVYPEDCTADTRKKVPLISFDGKKAKSICVKKIRKPLCFIPVFPGTNCEYDTEKRLKDAGADTISFCVRNLTKDDTLFSIKTAAALIRKSQFIVIPGGFSAGDEPDGAAKFIASFFRNSILLEEIDFLLEKRAGLIAGICNGFQALVKLGLIPNGKIIPVSEDSPALTFNKIGRHQHKFVNTRISSTISPWLSLCKTGDIYTIPVSHGEGRFTANMEVMNNLIKNGQIAAQYVNHEGQPSMETEFNPAGSSFAVEAVTSPDGRVLGKMGHCERAGEFLYKNIPGNHNLPIFEGAVKYFK